MLLAAPSTLAPLQEFVEWRLTKESDPNAELPKLHTLIPGHDYAWSGQIPLPGDEGSTMAGPNRLVIRETLLRNPAGFDTDTPMDVLTTQEYCRYHNQDLPMRYPDCGGNIPGIIYTKAGTFKIKTPSLRNNQKFTTFHSLQSAVELLNQERVISNARKGMTMADIQLVSAEGDTGFMHRPLWEFDPLLDLYREHYVQPQLKTGRKRKQT